MPIDYKIFCFQSILYYCKCNLQIINKFYFQVEYVEEPGVSNNTAFNTSFEGEAFPQLSELEQRVVSPLDPNMSCTACYSPVQYPMSRPSSPFQSSHTIIVDPPSSQQGIYVNVYIFYSVH